MMKRMKIEQVLGLTVPSNAALHSNPVSGTIAYPAGCTVVFLNPHKNKQSHLFNVSSKAISCLAFSSDGCFLATGEVGHQSSVRVWDLNDNIQVAELSSHKYGINCVIFSPNQKFVVSVGCQHDMIVNVWDWKSNIKIASNKVSSKVKSVSFSETSNYFVTVGNRHVKYWYLQSTRSSTYKEPVPLMGRSAILGEQRNNNFVDVACGRGSCADSAYAITKAGLLCEFNNRRLLDKWVELRTSSAKCITLGECYIFVGCADGIIRCFDPVTLQFITTLPRTHHLGVDVSMGLNISHMANVPKNAKYPDAIAVTYDELNKKVTCIYNDHSLYIWDVRNIKRVGKSHSYLYHSACIWGVEIAPPSACMPAGSFVTCSSDDTMRVWNLDDVSSNSDSVYQRNIYTNELLKILYTDPEMSYLKDLDMSSGDKNENSSYDGRNGVRSIRISPDGRYLASGDRTGNIRIHELESLTQICLIEAHDAEVLCLEFSPSFKQDDKNPRLLISASRDRLLHVFNVDDRYNVLQTLDDHSSSITAVRFYTTPDERLHMVSCGADKSIIFRHLKLPYDSKSAPQFIQDQVITGKTTLYDMDVDYTENLIITACQDRNIRIYNIKSGKHNKTFKGSIGDEGSLIKVVLDPSGIFVATSCTDKTLCLYDYYSGDCKSSMTGHSELVTGLRFSSDCTRLISASGDGCIFVWRVPEDMVAMMQARLASQACREQKYNSKLPLWAKRQISSDDNMNPIVPSVMPSIEAPRGRWAQRVGSSGIVVKSFYDEDRIIPSPITKEKLLESDGSKEDSSVDSGTETSRSLYPEVRRESLIIPKKDIESTEHDGDIEDYSESESTETELSHNTVYYSDTVSNEHLNLLGQREKYLKNTFDSLSAAEDSFKEKAEKKSLSSQHHEVATRFKNDPETLRRREELQRRIEETRKQLQRVGSKSNVKCSQSISDLRQIHQESPHFSNKTKYSPRYRNQNIRPGKPMVVEPRNFGRSNSKLNQEDEQLSGSMRRSCSLSDISIPASAPSTKDHGHVAKKSQGTPKPTSRTSQKPKLPPSSISRSFSVGNLIQSDSENELGPKNNKFSSISRIQRPTISSQNKMSTSSKTKFTHRRAMTGSYSSIAINHMGRDDSSSEELPDKSNQTRPRSSSIGRFKKPT